MQVIMPEINEEEKIKDQPITKIKANREIMDNYIYLDKEIFQIRRKKGRSVIFKKCF